MVNVIYEDDAIIVVHKPAGVATEAKGVANKDLVSELRTYRKHRNEPAEIFVVHRLDQPVSGLIVFAKTSHAAAVLSERMRDHEYVKEYKALVYHSEDVKDATLADYLLKDSASNTSRVVSKDTPGAKLAKLKYTVTCSDTNTAKLNILLETGRHHQIRVQLANAGLPILGDQKYGSSESINLSKGMGLTNVALCACHLTFCHPETNEKMSFGYGE